MLPYVNNNLDDSDMNAINTTIKAVRKIGSSIQDIVAKGQLTPNQYAELIQAVNGLVSKGDVSVSDINKNKGLLDQTYLSEDLLRKIAGNAPINAVPADNSITSLKLVKNSVTNDKMADLSISNDKVMDKAIHNRNILEETLERDRLKSFAVSADKTNFAKPGKNLFDGQYYYDRNVAGGVPNGLIGQQELNAVTTITKLDSPGSYTISKNGATDRFRVGLARNFPIYQEPVRLLALHDDVEQRTITANEGEIYLVITHSLNGVKPINLQIEKGNNKTDYEHPESVTLKLNKGSVLLESIEKGDVLNKVVKQKNLLNENNLYADTGITGGWGASSNKVNYLLPARYSYIVELEKGKTYTVAKTNSNRFRIGTTIGFPENEQELNRYLYFNDEGMTYSFTLEGEETHAIIYISQDDIIPEHISVEEGTTATPSQNGAIFDFTNTEVKGIEREEKFYIMHKPGGHYSSDSDYIYVYQRDINKLYGMYDKLVDDFPEYVSKTHLKNDEEGLPIYRYDFTPPKLGGAFGSNTHIPKIIYTSAIHGHEVAGAYGGFIFFDELCNKWKSKEILQMLRWNIHFIVIPILNPHGFNIQKRQTLNGVDLNRNFPAHWSENENNSGPKPFSEIASKMMRDLIDNEQNVIAGIDHHNFGPDSENGSPIWFGARNEDTRKIGDSFLQYSMSDFNKHYESSEDVNLSYRSHASPNGSLAAYYDSLGINGIMLETIYSINQSHENGQRFTADSLGNLIMGFIRFITK